MMPIKCLYIDDEKASEISPLWQAVQNASDGTLEFEVEQPEDFDPQIQKIKKKTPDLLVLDLRLDKNGTDKGKISYRGFSLAQELRTRMTEKRILSIPIVLWSVDSNLKDSYNLDDTAHNLLDKVYIKDRQVGHEQERVALELQSLAEGYELIREECKKRSVKLHKMLRIEDNESEFSDPRIGERFLSRKHYPAHEYARYIMTELINAPGMLINEKILAARLGVDIENSSHWGKLKGILNKTACYTGAFHWGWSRWWADKVDAWWKSRGNCPDSLQCLTAKERINFLRKTTRLKNLVEASPIEPGYSTRYWTICQGTEKPLDPIDGFRASRPDLKPWQAPPYLSIKAALDRTKWNKGVRVHSLERDRLAHIKAERKKNGARQEKTNRKPRSDCFGNDEGIPETSEFRRFGNSLRSFPKQNFGFPFRH